MRWAPFILILLLWSTPLFADDSAAVEKKDDQITAEDMKVIAMMETLELLEMMEMMEYLEVIEDMDILLEETDNDAQD